MKTSDDEESNKKIIDLMNKVIFYSRHYCTNDIMQVASFDSHKPPEIFNKKYFKQ